MMLGMAAMWVAIIVVMFLNNLGSDSDNQDAGPTGSNSDINSLTEVDMLNVSDEIDSVSRDTTEWLRRYKCGNTAGLPDAEAVEQRIVDVLADWEQMPAILRTGLHRSDPLLESKVTVELPEQLSEVRRAISAGPQAPTVDC